MKKQGVLNKIWRVLLPIFLYELLTMILTKILGGVAGGKLLEQPAAMWMVTLKNILMFPIFYWIYRKEQIGNTIRIPGVKNIFMVILGAVCISRGVNYFLSLTFLPHYFSGYQTVSDEIYRCSLLSQATATVISAPLLEELLMRGLVYGRLKEAIGEPRTAMIISAVIFGLFHGNVIQGIYAFIMGLFFVQVYEVRHSLFLAVLAHMVVNAASIFAGQMHWEIELSGFMGVYYLLTAGFLLIGMFCWKYVCYGNGERR